MGASNALLVVKIITDAKDAAKGLDDTSKSAGKFQSGMAKAGAAAAVAGGAVLAFGMDAANAAAEDAKGQAILAQSLKNSTGARQEDIASVEDWISKTAAATGVADDQLRPALATLARATGDVAKSQDALGVAMDVSAATGKDLGSVTDALAKGFGGNTASLGRLVPGMDKAILATGDMNKIMAELARTTGGSAAVAAETTEGKMQRMKLAMDETKESIGAALLPALTELADVLLKVSDWAQKNSTVFLALMGVIGGLSVVVLAYSAYQSVAAAATGIWTAAQWLLNAAFWANPLTWVIAGVVALIAVIVIIATKTNWFQNLWNAAWKAINAAITAVWNWIKSNWPMLLGILMGPIGIAVAFIVSHFDQITGAARKVWSYLSGAFSSIWGTISSIAQGALNAILGPIHAIESALGAVIGAIQNVIDWLGRIKVPNIGGAIAKLIPGGKSAPAPPPGHAAQFGVYAAGQPTVSGYSTPALRGPGGGGTNIQVTVNVPATANPAETGRAVAVALRSYFAAGGRLAVPT